MGLVLRSSSYDSVQEMDAARNDRYWDGLSCAVDGREFGGCYLLGYAIEMALKLAYFRFRGVAPTDNLAKELSTARQLARKRNANLHNLGFWVDTLIAERCDTGDPLDPALAGALQMLVSNATRQWSEILRYRRSIPARAECEELCEAYNWIMDHYHRLWS